MFRKSAFTITELSIVLVIIALITVSSTAGLKLVEQSKIHKLAQEFEENRTAIVAFRNAYDAFPGDMSSASSFWSGVGNGDGDGTIAELGSISETYKFWQQLSAAKFITGSYNGTSEHYSIKSFAGGGIFSVRTRNWGALGGGEYHLFFDLGKLDPEATHTGQVKFLSPYIISILDKKIDNGIAYSGNVIALDGRNTEDPPSFDGDCACAGTGTCSSDYSLSAKGDQCWTLLKLRADLM